MVPTIKQHLKAGGQARSAKDPLTLMGSHRGPIRSLLTHSILQLRDTILQAFTVHYVVIFPAAKRFSTSTYNTRSPLI